VAQLVATNGGAIQISGMREFRALLRRAESMTPADLKVAMNEIANGLIVPNAIALIKKNTNPDTIYTRNKKPGRLARSVKGASTTKEGRVKEGTAGVNSLTSYAGWWEFGGSTKSPIWGRGQRKFVEPGRAIYPAFVHRRKEIWEAMDLVLAKFSARMAIEG
jgi:hypothetical protein